jgi:acetyl esterase/lipase
MRRHPTIPFLAMCISTCLCHFACHPFGGYAQEPVCPWPQANNHPSSLETSSRVVDCPDVVYHETGRTQLRLDVSYPGQGTGPFPAVVLLHGCGPANKGRKGCVPLARELARNGYVGVAVDYRCKAELAYSTPLQDVNNSISWLRAHADQYKIDKDRIGVVGFSGGGTLACLLGMKGKGLQKESDRVRAVVSFYGATDLSRLHAGCLEKSKAQGSGLQSWLIMQTLEKWLGGPPSKVPEHYALVSPMSQSEKDSAPMLLIHGANDSIVPVEQSRLFAQRLQKSGRPVNLLIIEDAGHDFEEKNRTDGHLAFAAVLAFLDEHFQGARNIKALVKKVDHFSP